MTSSLAHVNINAVSKRTHRYPQSLNETRRTMNTEMIPMLNETAANIVENLAYQVAQRHGGTITVNHLAPYLPLSLSLIRACLDNMVDGHSLIASEENGFPTYEFAQTKQTSAETHEDH